MVYPSTQLRRILFLDIETASSEASFEELTDSIKEHWKKKARRHVNSEEYPYFDDDLEAIYQDKAAIHAEFARVVCISVGFIIQHEDQLALRIKTFVHEDEAILLQTFAELLDKHYYDKHNQFLCGHNIKEFDVPFICRRMMIHGIKLPNLLNIAGHKPWQTHHLLDTMEMWKYGDYKHYTSLDLLCEVLGVPTSKTDMNGAQVSRAFWDGRINEISQYCEEDVLATVRVYQRCVGLVQIAAEDVQIITSTSDQEEE